MNKFNLISDLKPTGDQPQAIEKISEIFNKENSKSFNQNQIIKLTLENTENLKIGKEPFITKFEKIPKMEAIAKNMLKDSIKLFSNFPEEKKAMKDAKNIFSQDDEIDHLNSQVQNDLINEAILQ